MTFQKIDQSVSEFAKVCFPLQPRFQEWSEQQPSDWLHFFFETWSSTYKSQTSQTVWSLRDTADISQAAQLYDCSESSKELLFQHCLPDTATGLIPRVSRAL